MGFFSFVFMFYFYLPWKSKTDNVFLLILFQFTETENNTYYKILKQSLFSLNQIDASTFVKLNIYVLYMIIHLFLTCFLVISKAQKSKQCFLQF